MMRLFSRLPLFARILAVCALSTPRVALSAEIALVIGKDSAAIRRSVAAIEALPDVRASRFSLFEGLAQVDQARDRLRRYPFQGVLTFGDSARSFVRDLALEAPQVHLFSSHAEDADLSPRVGPDHWSNLFSRLLQDERSVLALAGDPGSAPFLGGLQQSLGRYQISLDLGAPRPGEDLITTLDRVLVEGSAFFLPEDPRLLKRRVLLHLLKVCHRRKIALLSFSKVLVEAGALAALTISPETQGIHGARRVLGEEVASPEILVHLNQKRARYLGIEIPPELAGESPRLP